MQMKKSPKKLNVQPELEDESTFKGLSNEKTIRMKNGEMISPREWKKRFDSDWYFGTRNGEPKILTEKQHIADGIRNNNMRQRDALYASELQGSLKNINEEERQFMEDASDEWEWQNVFKTQGPEEAIQVIYSQAERDLQNPKLSVNITLTRFLVKMLALRTLNRREKRK